MQTHLVALALTLLQAVFADHHEALPTYAGVTFGPIAVAIAGQCQNAPLAGLDAEGCIAFVVEIGYRESRLDITASHDRGSGHGGWGVHDSTLGRPVPMDAAGQVEAAISLMRTSWAICRKEPLAFRFSWFAAGGRGCDRRHELSAFRMHEAAALLSRHRLPESRLEKAAVAAVEP